MRYIKQPPKSNQCGQACIAMVTGANLEFAIKLVGKSGRTGTKDLIDALDLCKNVSVVGSKRVRITKNNPLPEFCIVHISYVRKENGVAGGHWVVKQGRKIYDPAMGVFSIGRYKVVAADVSWLTHWRMTGFIPLER